MPTDGQGRMAFSDGSYPPEARQGEFDVFLSYASEDWEEVVEPLRKALEANGFTYWLDREMILWGQAILDEIQRGMANSRFTIFVLSSSSVNKPWPMTELRVALDHQISTRRQIVLVLLVGDKAQTDQVLARVPFLKPHSYFRWTGDPAPVVAKLSQRISWEDRVPPSGIVSRARVAASRKRLTDEVFVIELLEDPILLERDGTGVTITVDRRTVTDCVISNEGKRRLVAERVTTRKAVKEALEKEDARIQHFLAGETADRTSISPQALQVPLRWASGGILSIVRFRQREWVPLFFRDIPPYGWNISLGSTERQFDDDGRAVRDPEVEHRHPWNFILREFLEESMVLDRSPELENPPTPPGFRAFEAGFPWDGPTLERWRKHSELRRRCDHLDRGSAGRPIPLRQAPLSTKMALKILSSPRQGEPASERATTVSDVLVCFSLLDLGIEVVKVVTYELEEDDYLLDGEIDHTDCLVRMPIALFSLSYLREVFSAEETWYHYSHDLGEPPSIKVTRLPTEEEIFPFLWDIDQRRRIIDGEMPATEHERKRFADWKSRFGPNFFDDAGQPSLARPSCLFVPGTAKILNLYFSGWSG